MADAPAVLTRDQVDRQSLALELRQASQTAAPVRAAVAALAVALTVEAAKASAASPDGRLTAAQQDRIRALFAAELALLAVDVAARVDVAVTAAIALAWRQEAPQLVYLGVPVPEREAVVELVRADPGLADAGAEATRSLARDIDRIAAFAKAAPAATVEQVQALAVRAAGAVATVERDVRTVTNRAINETTRQIAAAAETARTAVAVLERPAPQPLKPPPAVPREPTARPVPFRHQLAAQPKAVAPAPAPAIPEATVAPVAAEPMQMPPPLAPHLRVVWQAERNACLTCLALSGQVGDPSTGLGFDEFATFSHRPAPAVWPPGLPLMKPPRHPRCRCRLRIIAAGNTMLPETLQREAQRTVARGWSGHTSRAARLSAADRLLARGATLPKTVKARAAEDVARGAFSTRHLPRTPQLRADRPAQPRRST